MKRVIKHGLSLFAIALVAAFVPLPAQAQSCSQGIAHCTVLSLDDYSYAEFAVRASICGGEVDISSFSLPGAWYPLVCAQSTTCAHHPELCEAGNVAPYIQVPYTCACNASLPGGALHGTGATCNGLLNGAWSTNYQSTFNPSEWSGTGCFRKACVEVSGLSNWPAECGAQ